MPKTTQSQKPSASNSHSQTPPISLNQGSWQVSPQLLQRAIANPNAGNLTPSVVQRLQQQYGNRFVMQLVQRMGASAPSKASPIQGRFKYVGNEDNEMAEAVENDIGEGDADMSTKGPIDLWEDDTGHYYTLESAVQIGDRVEINFQAINSKVPPRVFRIPAQIGSQHYQQFTSTALHYQNPNPPHNSLVLQDLNKVTDYRSFDPTSLSAPNAKSSFTNIPQASFDKAYHKTTFLGRVSLVPMGSVRGNEIFTPREIWVEDVKIPDDRPPTQFGREGQKSHTVAWTLLRVALQKLQGQPLDKFFTILNGLLKDVTPSEYVNPDRAFTALKAKIDTGIAHTQDASKPAEIFYWQRLASDLIGQYVHLYQISHAATYMDGRAIGHGEPEHMAMLNQGENTLKQGRTITSTEIGDYKNAAIGLMDIKNRLGSKTIAQVYHHWINLLHLAFPLLMRNHHDAIVAGLQLDESQKLALTTVFGKDPTQPVKSITDKPTTRSFESSHNMPETAITKAHQSTFTANVFVVPQKSVARMDIGLQTKNNDQVENTNILALGHYQATDLKIEQVDVANDRPKTRWGILQKSHTVAWTFIRRVLISFGGKSASDLLEFIRGELPTLKQDIPLHSRKIAYDAPAEAERLHLNLAQITANPNGFPIHQWQSRLSELVESYITLYQLSRSATYAKEERPAPHGESNAINTLDRYEAHLSGINDPNLRLTFITPNLTEVAKQARHLVDAVIATPTLAPQQWKTAIQHWLKLLKVKYPTLMGIQKVEQTIKDKVTVAEPKQEYLAGYNTGSRRAEFNVQQKLLINLYEEALLTVRGAVTRFHLDLQAILLQKLTKAFTFDSPDWEKLVAGMQLSEPQLRPYQEPLQSYLSRDGGRRKSTGSGIGSGKPLPTKEAIQKLLADVAIYNQKLKGSKDKIVQILLVGLQKRANKTSINDVVNSFAQTKSGAIQQEIEEAFDDAIEGSVVSQLKQAKKWFQIIEGINRAQGINYQSLMNAIT